MREPHASLRTGPGILGAFAVAGLLYGFAEFARQAWWMPSPVGVPGDSGGSLFAYLLVGLSFVALPASVFWLLLAALARGRSPRLDAMRVAASWAAGLLPTLLLFLDQWAELAGWTWLGIDAGGMSYYLRLLSLGGVVALPFLVILTLLRRRLLLPRPVGAGFLILVLAAPVLLSSQLRTPSSPHDPSSPTADEADRAHARNVLLITIDTVRQDALAPYGGSVELPPSLAVDQPRALDGWTVSSWTRPSMASLFCGVAPTGHGADREQAPSTEVPWFSETFAGAGYENAAFVTNPHLRRRYGFDRGFATFDHEEEFEFLEPVARSIWAEWWQRRRVERDRLGRADRVVGRALDWIDARDSSRPYFVWVHLLDPHLPYELRGKGGAPTVEGPPPVFMDELADVMSPRGFTDIVGARAGDVVNTPAQREALHDLYLTEVDFALHWAGELVARAREAAGSRGLAWVITSDHGEEFWDEGGFEHGHTFHDSVVRIPMLLSGAGVDSLTARQRLIDVGPRLMGLAGLTPQSRGRFDPRTGSGLLDTDRTLDAFALPTVTSAPALLIEEMLYGPQKTLVVDPSGTALERNDETGQLRLVRRFGEPAPPDSSQVPFLEGILRSVDFWRERTADRGRSVEVDADLLERLRAVGYVH